MKIHDLSNKGIVTVEALIVLPLLLLVVGVVVELSIFVYKKIELLNAVEMATHMYAATGDESRARQETLNNYGEGRAFSFSCWADSSTHLASCGAEDTPSNTMLFLNNMVHFRAKSYAPTAD